MSLEGITEKLFTHDALFYKSFDTSVSQGKEKKGNTFMPFQK
jgi:hypothetical protein